MSRKDASETFEFEWITEIQTVTANFCDLAYHYNSLFFIMNKTRNKTLYIAIFDTFCVNQTEKRRIIANR